MSMVSAQQDDAVMAEINITPFTDVLLVLLIIFMILAALVAPPGFEKQLPDKSDKTPQQQQKKTLESSAEFRARMLPASPHRQQHGCHDTDDDSNQVSAIK